MKKSEAVKLLKIKYEGSPIDNENWAEQIIDMCESIGMMPPTVCFLAIDKYSELKDLDILHDYDISFAWEPENG